MSENGTRIYRFKSFLLNVEERQLFDGDRPLALTPKTFDVLVHLVENAGRLVHKDDLMKAVWPNSFVEEVNIPRSVHHLRKTLRQDNQSNRLIETVPTKGYRFIVPVLIDAGPAAADRVDGPAVDPEASRHGLIGQAGIEARSEPKTAIRNDNQAVPATASAWIYDRRWIMVAVICVILVAGLPAWLFYRFAVASRSTNPFQDIKLSRLTNTGGVKRLTVSPDGNFIAYVSDGKDGEGLFVRQTQMSNTLSLVSPQKGHFSFVRFSPDGKDIFYGRFTGDRKDTEVFTVPALGGVARKIPNLVAYSMSFAPDRRFFAHVISNMEGGEKTLMKSSIDGEVHIPLKTRKLPSSFNVVEKPCSWSPDGKVIAVIGTDTDQNGRFSTVIGINPDDGSEVSLTTNRWTHLDSVTWLRDQTGLLVVGSDGPEGTSQIWFVSAADGRASRLTNDLNDYSQIDITDDGTQIVAMQESRTSSVWFGPLDLKSGTFIEVASNTGVLDSVATTPQGDVVFRSNADGSSEIWSIRSNGEKRQITVRSQAVGAGLCFSQVGDRVVFPSRRGGKTNLWSTDLDGGDLKQITDGEGEFFPVCSSNDRSVIYQSGFGYGVKSTLWKVPLEGGEPVQLTSYFAMRPTLSSDGSLIAFFYMTDDKWRIGIIPSSGGPIQRGVDVPEGVHDRVVRWSRDANSLIYSSNSGKIGNVWLLPLTGEPPKQLTDFDSHLVQDFSVTSDGKHVAIARTSTAEDVVSLTSLP